MTNLDSVTILITEPFDVIHLIVFLKIRTIKRRRRVVDLGQKVLWVQRRFTDVPNKVY